MIFCPLPFSPFSTLFWSAMFSFLFRCYMVLCGSQGSWLNLMLFHLFWSLVNVRLFLSFILKMSLRYFYSFHVFNYFTSIVFFLFLSIILIIPRWISQRTLDLCSFLSWEAMSPLPIFARVCLLLKNSSKSCFDPSILWINPSRSLVMIWYMMYSWKNLSDISSFAVIESIPGEFCVCFEWVGVFSIPTYKIMKLS